MKRNWLTYVSIVAALVAGMVCSTAFAEGKKGGNISGGNFRLSNGNGGSSSSSLQSQGLPKVFKPQITQGISGIQTMPRNSGGSANGGSNNGLGIGLGSQIAKKPQIFVNPGLNQGIGGAVLGNGNKPKITINPGLGQSIGGAVLGGKVKIDPGFGAGKSIGGAVLGKGGKIDPGFGVGKSINDAVLGKHCIPGCNPKPCDPCCKPCNKWCGPCWWWSPCWDPCYKSCYYPCTVYAYPQTIVIPVVVGTPVVAEQVMQIPVGATVTLQGTNLGDQLGMLVVQIDKVSLPAQVNEWKPEGVNVTLPMVGLAGPTRAQLWMVRADGTVAANVAVELLPAQQQAAAAGQAAGQDAAAAALGAIQ